jgi:curli biogenesis system outer membrane secretion channel CsgG
MANRAGSHKKIDAGQSLMISFLLLIPGCLATKAQAQQLPRIAVMSFDVGSDAKLNAKNQFGMTDDLGRDLSDMLLDKLVADGRYSVIERSQLEKIVQEQNQSNGDRNDPASAAKIGKIAGVSAIVIGNVTQYGGEVKESKINIPGIKLGPFSTKKSQVSVKINARLIDTNTGEVIAVASADGEASESKTDAAKADAIYSTKTKDFGTSTIGKATVQAISFIADKVEHPTRPVGGAAPPPPPPPVPVAASTASYSGLVAYVSGNTIVVNVGAKAGVKVGDTVNISRPGEPVKDPVSGAVIKVMMDQIGQAKVTEMDDGTATATYTGTAPVKVRDQVSRAN